MFLVAKGGTWLFSTMVSARAKWFRHSNIHCCWDTGFRLILRESRLKIQAATGMNKVWLTEALRDWGLGLREAKTTTDFVLAGGVLRITARPGPFQAAGAEVCVCVD